MNRNFDTPRVDANWINTHETHPAVACAIHAIAGAKRTAEAIWEAPTPGEWDTVTMAVAEYVAHGDFAAEEDGRYAWGQETITLEVEA